MSGFPSHAQRTSRGTLFQRGFTLIELTVAIVIVILLAGIGVAVFPQIIRQFEESDGRTSVRGALLHARNTAIEQERSVAVLFYQWRTPQRLVEGGPDPTAVDYSNAANGDDLIAGTDMAIAYADESEGGAFVIQGGWRSLPEGITVISPGRQYVQTSPDSSSGGADFSYRYPNPYLSLQSNADDVNVMGIGFAIVFDRFGRIDQSLIDAGTPRLVEMTWMNPPTAGVSDRPFRLFVADDVASDSIDDDTNSGNIGLLHRRRAVNGFAQVDFTTLNPSDATISGSGGIVARPEASPIRPYLIDRESPSVIRYSSSGTIVNSTNTVRVHADEHPNPRLFLPTRAFAITDYLAIVSTGDLALLHDLVISEGSPDTNVAFHRDLSPAWFADALDGEALFPQTGVIADQLPFRDETTATAKFQELASRFDWLAFHRGTGQLLPVTEDYN